MATAVHQELPFIPRQNCVTHDVLGSENEDAEISDLHLLKEVSQRLNLATRRPSTVQWKQIIEFRKSIGLYNSDVEPEYLDKVVEAKMKTNSKKTYTKRRKFTRSGKDEKNDSDATIQAKNDDKLNNNTDHKLPKVLKSKYERAKLLPRDNGQIVDPKIPQNEAKSSPKVTSKKSSTDIVANTQQKPAPMLDDDFKTMSNSKDNNGESSLVSGNKKNSDVIKELLSNKGTMTNGICRFPLYDTDDDVEQDTAGMSEMAIRHRNIDRALGKIRRDLITMRMEDNSLARKLLDTRSEINLIRVRQSCDAHAEMLDDVTYELEEEDLLPGLIKACDLPSRQPGSLLSAFSPLRMIGVSRMNINRRRFSIR